MARMAGPTVGADSIAARRDAELTTIIEDEDSARKKSARLSKQRFVTGVIWVEGTAITWVLPLVSRFGQKVRRAASQFGMPQCCPLRFVEYETLGQERIERLPLSRGMGESAILQRPYVSDEIPVAE
jgi:hypothetical protein